MNKFLLTLAAGIAIGIVVAPHKGSKTRKIIRDGFDEYKDKATDMANDIIDGVDRTYTRVKNKFNSAI
jgi:gas vesicle protein